MVENGQMSKKPKRIIWKKWSDYHRHSLAETQRHYLKIDSMQQSPPNLKSPDRKMGAFFIVDFILKNFQQSLTNSHLSLRII